MLTLATETCSLLSVTPETTSGRRLRCEVETRATSGEYLSSYIRMDFVGEKQADSRREADTRPFTGLDVIVEQQF